MEAIMDAHGLWDVVEPPTGVPSKKKTAKEVLDSLKSRYAGAERVQKARLRILKSEFEGLHVKDGENIDEYAGKLSGMASKFTNVGAVLEDEELVRKLFDTVQERFINLVASIEQSSDVESMSFKEAIAHLKAYEDRVKLRQSQKTSEGSSLFTKSEECREPKEKPDEVNLNQVRGEEPALYLTIHGEDTPNMVLLNEDRVFPRSSETKEVWYVDNGASNHITGMKESFAELD
ncbi:uncharacterized protein LOC143557900 [Bidens hawaiensis]|uniref:uncharacterized protein LOC143557900 n=1 Tax=Bidens hawaiensis TaxID=980011 RepID=UPI00404B3C05